MSQKWAGKTKKPTISQIIDPILKEFDVFPSDQANTDRAGDIPGKAYVGVLDAIAQQQPYYDRGIEFSTGVLETSAAAAKLHSLLRSEGKSDDDARVIPLQDSVLHYKVPARNWQKRTNRQKEQLPAPEIAVVRYTIVH